MKKLMIFMLFAALTLPFYAAAKNTHANYLNKMRQDVYHPYQSYDFNAEKPQSQTYDYLGFLDYGGVAYDCYGTYPDIYEIVAQVGTVYSFTACHIVAAEINVDTWIDSSNGFFHYRGVIWNY